MSDPLEPRRTDDPAPPAPEPHGQPEGEPVTADWSPEPPRSDRPTAETPEYAAPEAPTYEAPQYEGPTYEAPQYQPPEAPAYDAPQAPAYQAQQYPPISAIPAYGPTASPADPYSNPVSGTAHLPVPYPPAPASYPPVYQPVPVVMAGHHGYDPVTGQPYSDKSKVMAGLLQILPGFLFSLGGIGRLYAGNTMLGLVQLVASVIGWSAFWCGFLLGVPFALWGAIWIWFLVDGIVMLAGRPLDGQGRPLRS